MLLDLKLISECIPAWKQWMFWIWKNQNQNEGATSTFFLLIFFSKSKPFTCLRLNKSQNHLKSKMIDRHQRWCGLVEKGCLLADVFTIFQRTANPSLLCVLAAYIELISNAFLPCFMRTRLIVGENCPERTELNCQLFGNEKIFIFERDWRSFGRQCDNRDLLGNIPVQLRHATSAYLCTVGGPHQHSLHSLSSMENGFYGEWSVSFGEKAWVISSPQQAVPRKLLLDRVFLPLPVLRLTLLLYSFSTVLRRLE